MSATSSFLKKYMYGLRWENKNFTKNTVMKYRKRPCISRTFFHKIEAKNQGCGLSTDTAVFGVLKNLINIDKTSQDVKK